MLQNLPIQYSIEIEGTPVQFANLVWQFKMDNPNFECFPTRPVNSPINAWERGATMPPLPLGTQKVVIKFFGDFPTPDEALQRANSNLEPTPLSSSEGFITAELKASGKSLLTVQASDADWPAVKPKWEKLLAHLKYLEYIGSQTKSPRSSVYNINIDTAYGTVIGDRTEVKQTFHSPSNQPSHELWPKMEAYLARIETMVLASHETMRINFADIKRGQAFLCRQINEADQGQLGQILDLVKSGRLDQGEMERTLDAIRRALRVMQANDTEFGAEMREAIASFHSVVESTLGLTQKLELTLPIVPGFLEYKVELDAGSNLDLNALRAEISQRWQSLLAQLR